MRYVSDTVMTRTRNLCVPIPPGYSDVLLTLFVLLTLYRIVLPIGDKEFQLKLQIHWYNKGLSKKKFFIWSCISSYLWRPAQRYNNFSSKSSLKISKTLLPVSPYRVLCAKDQLRYSVLLTHQYCTIWCRSTFGPRGPGLSYAISFLRPALPMTPTTDDNAGVKRSVFRPAPIDFAFSRDPPNPLALGSQVGVVVCPL